MLLRFCHYLITLISTILFFQRISSNTEQVMLLINLSLILSVSFLWLCRPLLVVLLRMTCCFVIYRSTIINACIFNSNGAVGGDQYEILSSILHVIHVHIIFLTACRPLVIQYWLLIWVNVSLPLLWYFLLWLSLIISSVMWWFFGIMVGCLHSNDKLALCSLPPLP